MRTQLAAVALLAVAAGGVQGFVAPAGPACCKATAGVRRQQAVTMARAGGEGEQQQQQQPPQQQPGSLASWQRAWEDGCLAARRGAGKVMLGALLLLGPGVASRPASAEELDLKAQLAELSKQVVMQDKFLRMGRNKQFEKRLPTFPVVKDGVKLDAKKMKDAIERIQVLEAYLDEVERDIYERQWRYVPGFLEAFVEQEDAFLQLIEGLYPTESQLDKSARDALSYEAQNLFVELDNLREAAKFQRPKSAEKAYAKIALAYDRFRKAGDLYGGYDPVTSTEVFYNLPSVPAESIKYDEAKAPQVSDRIVVLGGPDKGKTGKLIGMDGDIKGVVKLDTNGAFTEVKIINIADVGKQLQGE